MFAPVVGGIGPWGASGPVAAQVAVDFGVMLVFVAVAGILIELSHPGVSLPSVVAVAALVGAVFVFSGAWQPGTSVSWPVLVGVAVLLALLVALAWRAALRTRRAPVVTGAARLVGTTGTVVRSLAPDGAVWVGGEEWSARAVGVAPAALPVPERTEVRIVAVKGLVLEVAPQASEEVAQ